MRDFFTVAYEKNWRRSSWIVFGKGPSFDPELERHFDNSFVLNHAIKHVKHATIAHVIDLEAVCVEVLSRAEYLLMPYEPNLKFDPCGRTVDEIARDGHYHIISEMQNLRRLLSYNRVGTLNWSSTSPKVEVVYFSAEAAVGCLAAAGVKRIHLSGVDGGTGYSPHFSDMHPLENGHESFDKQFPRMQEICKQHGSEIKAVTRETKISDIIL